MDLIIGKDEYSFNEIINEMKPLDWILFIRDGKELRHIEIVVNDILITDAKLPKDTLYLLGEEEGDGIQIRDAKSMIKSYSLCKDCKVVLCKTIDNPFRLDVPTDNASIIVSDICRNRGNQTNFMVIAYHWMKGNIIEFNEYKDEECHILSTKDITKKCTIRSLTKRRLQNTKYAYLISEALDIGTSNSSCNFMVLSIKKTFENCCTFGLVRVGDSLKEVEPYIL